MTHTCYVRLTKLSLRTDSAKSPLRTVKLQLARSCRRHRPLLLQINPPPNPVRVYDSDSRDALSGLNLHSSIEQQWNIAEFSNH